MLRFQLIPPSFSFSHNTDPTISLPWLTVSSSLPARAFPEESLFAVAEIFLLLLPLDVSAKLYTLVFFFLI